MRKRLFFLFFCIIYGSLSTNSYGQVFDKVTFSQLPQDWQLYPRKTNNQGIITIKGTVTASNIDAISLLLYRNKQLIGYQKITSLALNSSFSFKDLAIKAELAEYDVKLYTFSKTDSSLIVERVNIVAGDIFVINGQSNAGANFGDDPVYFTSEYARNFGKLLDFTYLPAYNPADTLWNTQAPGKLGNALQKLIIEKHKIPVAILNQANGGSTVTFNAIRTNPVANFGNTYGVLYYRLLKAGVLNDVKGYIWRQGENESSGAASLWGENFDILYKYWRQDYPNIQKYYVYQVSLLDFPLYAAGQLRDYQRRTKYIYDRVENITAIGLPDYDGIHYGLQGHIKSAEELFLQISRDFYGSTDTDNITCPNIQKVYRNNKDNIILEFDKGQEIVWQNDTTLINKYNQPIKQYLHNMFFTKNNNRMWVLSGYAVGNKVILDLAKDQFSYSVLNYLPAFHTSEQTVQFGGPFIKNKRGLRAFSFHEVPVGTITDNLALKTQISNGNQVALSWNKLSSADYYILDRKSANSTVTHSIKIDKNLSAYIDTQAADDTLFRYVLTAYSKDTANNFSMQNVVIPIISHPTITAQLRSHNSIVLQWNRVQQAKTYLIERTTDNSIKTYQTNQLSLVDTGLVANVTYSYRIKALADIGQSDFSSYTKVSTLPLLASPTASLKALFKNKLEFSFQNVPQADSLIIEYKESSNLNDYTLLSKRRNLAGTIVLNDLKSNTSYSVRIMATAQNRISAWTIITLSTPADLVAPVLNIDEVTYKSVLLSWTSVTGATSYLLERRKDNDNFTLIDTLKSTAYKDSLVKDNTSYTYRIKALATLSDSPTSTKEVRTTTILGTEELINEPITLAPNPTTDWLSIKFVQRLTGSLSIYNSSGENVYQAKFNDTSTLELSLKGLRKGPYFVKISTAKGQFTKRLIIL